VIPVVALCTAIACLFSSFSALAALPAFLALLFSLRHVQRQNLLPDDDGRRIMPKLRLFWPMKTDGQSLITMAINAKRQQYQSLIGIEERRKRQGGRLSR
jgi:hypothetical protein